MMKSSSMVHRNHRYKKILQVSAVREKARSLSLPNELDASRGHSGSERLIASTDSQKLQSKKDVAASPTHDSWFNTWPERYEKVKTSDATQSETTSSTTATNNTQIATRTINTANCKGKLTLDEALRSISLAYSPVTKQLHLLEVLPRQETTACDNTIENDLKSACKENGRESHNFANGKKLGHRRNEPGSYSSTISTLSEPSPSGSLLESDDCYSLNGIEAVSSRKRSISSFVHKNVLSWKSSLTSPSSTASVWKIFSKSNENPASSPQHGIVSSAALIPNMRPSHLPAKTEEEELRHREEYKEMLAGVKRKEALNSAAKQKQQKLQLQQEEQQAQSAKHFMQTVLHNWQATTRKTRDLWWLGLPSSVRGRVWRMAIGNELNLTRPLYEICLSRAQSRLNSVEPPQYESEVDQESSMDVIQLDISRTFPSLCIFQEGGPYSDVLHSLLAAYVCYRPDVGYVQGMSYIAAILILNMDEFDAFVCFANLLNGPLHIAAFTLNQFQIQAYYNAYNEIFNYNLPRLYNHFEYSGLTPDFYLLDWIYTIFAKAMPLDIACRVWDLFLRDGDEFLFRTALGVLHLNQDLLLKMDFLHGAQFLTRLPDDMVADQLFKSIQTMSTGMGKLTFNQIVDKCRNQLGVEQPL